ncbi:hypothetical protein B5X24_HaOG208504 [Helicoverpa armigera]|uniref:Uncharacterized protein n=1 Tax=Helicoverpa armigera TaxID=29058 RepID=A0A2W1BFT8_HELAM|nr:hypothetical protein B5X24_HaOG208504 [Helicoverpa armigera]
MAAMGVHTERLLAVVTHLTLRQAAAEKAALCKQPAVVTPARTTFANALRLGSKTAPVPIVPPSGPAVAIYPAEDQRETLKTADINSAQLGVQIHSVRKIGNAGLLVSTTSPAAAAALKSAVPATLRAAEPAVREPLVALTSLDGAIPKPAGSRRLDRGPY